MSPIVHLCGDLTIAPWLTGNMFTVGMFISCIVIAVGHVDFDIITVVGIPKQGLVAVLQLFFSLGHSCVGAVSCSK